MVPARPFFIGSPGWVRSSAWIWFFASTESTMAWSGGLTYKPTISLSLAANCGSLDSLKRTYQMRSQAMSAPDTLHRTDADPSRLRHCRARPMAGCWRRPRQGHGDNPVRHFRAQRWNTRGARLVAPKPRRALVPEPFLPAPDHRLVLAGGAHDFGSAIALGRHQHNLCPPDVLLRAVAVSHHRLKRTAVDRTQLNVRSLV